MISCSPSLIKESSFLEQRRRIIEDNNESNHGKLDPSSNRYIPNTAPWLRLSEHCKRMGRKDWKRQRIRKFVVGLCLIMISEATFIKSHQYDCQQVSLTRVTSINLANCKKKISRSLTITQKSIGNWGKLRSEEVVLTESSTQNGCPFLDIIFS